MPTDFPTLLKRIELARRQGKTQVLEALTSELQAAQAVCTHESIIEGRVPMELPSIKPGQKFTKCSACTKLLTVDGQPVT